MTRKTTYTAPNTNPYDTLIQSNTPDQMPEQQKMKKTAPDDYRFSMRVSAESGAYIREMAWRHRVSITEFVARIIEADMKQHPEWKETIDVLNITKK